MCGAPANLGNWVNVFTETTDTSFAGDATPKCTLGLNAEEVAIVAGAAVPLVADLFPFIPPTVALLQ